MPDSLHDLLAKVADSWCTPTDKQAQILLKVYGDGSGHAYKITNDGIDYVINAYNDEQELVSLLKKLLGKDSE